MKFKYRIEVVFWMRSIYGRKWEIYTGFKSEDLDNIGRHRSIQKQVDIIVYE